MPKEGAMRVPAKVFGVEPLVKMMERDRTFSQLRNVATLPGIINYAMVMPDAHEGYGFPIGGVAAFDPDNGGVVSPGGVGYDINCGVRLIKTCLSIEEVKAKTPELVKALFRNVPSGVGSKGKLRLTPDELKRAVTEGAGYVIKMGYGWDEDKDRCEEYGRLEGADPSVLSDMAIQRGAPQFGTVGAGNHFVEIEDVHEVFNESVAKSFGLEKGRAAVLFHCGSRGFGHQVCSDYLKVMHEAGRKYKINLPDMELACAPLGTAEADSYLKAMACAVNYAFCNRQVMTHWIRETFGQVFGNAAVDEMHVVYDVCHNVAKFEEHEVNGKRMTVCVHRKGATRAFPAGRKEVPKIYRDVGQPVLIPGSMGTFSYVLAGKEGSMKKSFGSSCHGSGRVMSRKEAIRTFKSSDLQEKLKTERGVIVQVSELDLLAEEAPGAYKDVDSVVRSVQIAGLTDAVVKLKPVGVVKG